MKDYTHQKEFWKRLSAFVEKVEVSDPMSEEEKDMIIVNCENKLNQ